MWTPTHTATSLANVYRRAPSALALAALLAGCGSPPVVGVEDDSAGVTTDPDADGSDTGEVDPCPPWPQLPDAIGLGGPLTFGFVDATVEAGLADADYFAGDWPQGCDPDGEGVVQTPCKELLQGAGAAAGDFDDDGWPDLYLSRLGGPDLLFRNLGDGSFEEVAASVGLTETFDGNGAAWVDVDGDADLDLYVTAAGDPARFWFYRNQLAETGAATFVEQAHARGLALDDGLEHWGFSIAVGDYDRDGWLDLYTSEWRPGPSVTEDDSHARLLHNLGDGYYEDRTKAANASMLAINPAGVYAFSPTFVDLDEDGWQDLAVVADNGTTRLFWNHAGGFVEGTPTAGVGIERNGMGSTFGDLDGDGHLDWYVTAIFSPDEDLDCGNPICGQGGNRLYRSVAPRCFEEIAEAHQVDAGGWGWGASVWDPDNDGDLDLVETNGFHVPHGPPGTFFVGDPMRVWLNQSQTLGAMGFEESSTDLGLDHAGQGRGLLVFDYDRDGDQDLLVLDSGQDTRLWRNDGGNQNAWLDVELRGDPDGGNRFAVGARVELRRTPSDPPQIRVVGLESHFLGQGENRVHFGLGPSEAAVAEVRVTWPVVGDQPGEQTVVQNVAVRQTIVIDAD